MHCKCCNLIGSATCYLFIDRYQVRLSPRPVRMTSAKGYAFLLKKNILVLLCVWNNSYKEHRLVPTKTIRKFALNFYTVIIDSSFTLMNYHLLVKTYSYTIANATIWLTINYRSWGDYRWIFTVPWSREVNIAMLTETMVINCFSKISDLKGISKKSERDFF